jgi:hypothetical protein
VATGAVDRASPAIFISAKWKNSLPFFLQRLLWAKFDMNYHFFAQFFFCISSHFSIYWARFLFQQHFLSQESR